MQIKWSLVALAVAASSAQMAVASQQSESNGFVEDSSLEVVGRTLYMNRDFRNGDFNTNPVTGKTNGYREETGLGIRALYESGFTQGTVGFGVDAHSLTTIKLDSGEGRTSNGMFGVDSDGRAEATQSEVGGAVKVRVSNTTLKYGSQLIDTPVFSGDDGRLSPEVATGTLLSSAEIEGLEVVAGRFTALSSMAQTTRDDLGLTQADIAGVSYAFNDNLSAGLYSSNIEDQFQKRYLNVNYTLPLGEQSLVLDLNAYRTRDAGRALSGAIDNNIWSLMAAYTIDAHTLSVGYQRSTGDTGYVYGADGGGTVYLGNSVQYSDFIGEDERSWQVRYDIDMAGFGVPGLTLMSRYVSGYGIDVGAVRDAKEHELDLEAKYVIQSGAAKDLSLRVRNAVYRADSVYSGDINEVRFIAEYPLSVL